MFLNYCLFYCHSTYHLLRLKFGFRTQTLTQSSVKLNKSRYVLQSYHVLANTFVRRTLNEFLGCNQKK